jgi:hypothetical protein
VNSSSRTKLAQSYKSLGRSLSRPLAIRRNLHGSRRLDVVAC